MSSGPKCSNRPFFVLPLVGSLRLSSLLLEEANVSRDDLRQTAHVFELVDDGSAVTRMQAMSEVCSNLAVEASVQWPIGGFHRCAAASRGGAKAFPKQRTFPDGGKLQAYAFFSRATRSCR